MMMMRSSSLMIGAARGSCSRRCHIPISSSAAAFSTYAEEKLAAKEIRRQRFESKVARLQSLPTRREGRPKDVKKDAFKSWYDKRRTYHEIMDRKARQGGKAWKIEVAAVVERLPVVTPDLESWEAKWVELREHLDQFTWDYPKELAVVKEFDDDDGELILLFQNYGRFLVL